MYSDFVPEFPQKGSEAGRLSLPIRKARAIESSSRIPRPLPRTVDLGDGVVITIERMREHGPFGFVVRSGMLEFAAYDCEWTDEDAESRAIRAAVVRLGIE